MPARANSKTSNFGSLATRVSTYDSMGTNFGLLYGTTTSARSFYEGAWRTSGRTPLFDPTFTMRVKSEKSKDLWEHLGGRKLLINKKPQLTNLQRNLLDAFENHERVKALPERDLWGHLKEE